MDKGKYPEKKGKCFGLKRQQSYRTTKTADIQVSSYHSYNYLLEWLFIWPLSPLIAPWWEGLLPVWARAGSSVPYGRSRKRTSWKAWEHPAYKHLWWTLWVEAVLGALPLPVSLMQVEQRLLVLFCRWEHWGSEKGGSRLVSGGVMTKAKASFHKN